MRNIDAMNRFINAHSVKIEKLFWIAASFDSSDFKDLLSGINDHYWHEMLPEVYKSEYFLEYRDNEEEGQMLIDLNKLGFIAEIHMPECDDFRFKDGKPSSWSMHEGLCAVGYVYGETPEELLNKIEQAAEKNFQYNVKKHKERAA